VVRTSQSLFVVIGLLPASVLVQPPKTRSRGDKRLKCYYTAKRKNKHYIFPGSLRTSRPRI